MATYLIGDVQGCYSSLQRLLQKIQYNPGTDTVYLLGDLVNRGPQSLETLRFCQEHADSVHVLLGNHDLHLLACAYGERSPGRRDTLAPILTAPDAPQLLHWLARQPLARHLRSPLGQDVLLVHAGVLPQWTLADTLAYAQEVQATLASSALPDFLRQMYGNTPAQWRDDLRGMERLRTIVNALTRLRFCSAEGVMDFSSSEAADTAPEGLLPWFLCPGRRTQDCSIAFGHWSTLGLRNTPQIMALDTGCVWGGQLTALELAPDDFTQRQLHHIDCPQSQRPGVV